jgi:xanthine dehydrogenase accessory factor
LTEASGAWISEALQRVIEGRRFADVATVITADASSPVSVGVKLVVEREGETWGTLGDARLDGAVIADARQVLASRRSQVKSYRVPGPAGEIEVEVFHEVLEPQPELLIVGAGHIAVPLARFGKLLGFDVSVVDDRDKYASVERFPEADRVIAADFGETLQDWPITPATYVVIITRAHTYDEEALRLILQRESAYIGMIGSRRRVQVVLRTLANEGYERDRLAIVRAPIGLDIGAETPDEIALAIISEVVAARRGGTGMPLSQQERPVAY